MIPTVVSNSYEEQIDFQKYWLTLKRNWLPATAIFVGISSIFLLSALARKPTYEAEAQLLIRADRSSKLVGLDEDRGETVKVIGKDSNPIETEAEILQSRPILEKAIKQLNLRDDRGKLLNYQEIVGDLKVEPVMGTDILQVSYQNSNSKLAASIVNKIVSLYVQEDTSSNRAAAVSARMFIKTQLPKIESTVAKAEADLRQFKTENKIANLSQEATGKINAIESLESQIETQTTKLEDVNSRLDQLSSQLKIDWQDAIAISSLGESAIPRLITELQQVRIDLVNQSDRFSENAPQIISLKEREAELKTLLENQIEQVRGDKQRDSLKNTILNISDTNSSPTMITALANAGVERTGLVNELAVLKRNLQARQQKLEKLPHLEEQQRELERRVEATQSTYQTLLSQLQKTQVAENQNVGNVRIIANAVVPEQPTGSASKKLIVLVGSLVGGLLGIAFAFLLDFNDRSIKNSKEAEEIFGYPLQGMIPNFALPIASNSRDRAEVSSTSTSQTFEQDSLTPGQNQHFTALRSREAYQVLQANLKLLSTDWERKAIAVTSSVPQEGKSEVASNLAKSMAQLGKTILLIDADLRRPTQHHILGLNNSTGLSNVLLGEARWEQVVQPVMSNLDVLTAGTGADNPVSLLNSERMKNLTQTMSRIYDCIIIDTPPLIGMADTLVLSNVVDSLLLVVRPGVVDRESAIAVKKLLANIEQDVLGIVTNRVNPKNEPYANGYFEHY